MFAIFVTYAVIPALCLSSQNFMKWKPFEPESSLLWNEGKKKSKTTEGYCLCPALDTTYKWVTEVGEYY